MTDVLAGPQRERERARARAPRGSASTWRPRNGFKWLQPSGSVPIPHRRWGGLSSKHLQWARCDWLLADWLRFSEPYLCCFYTDSGPQGKFFQTLWPCEHRGRLWAYVDPWRDSRRNSSTCRPDGLYRAGPGWGRRQSVFLSGCSA